MRFGIFAMPEHPPWENWSLSFERDLEEIRKAEWLGFDEFWIGEHHSGEYENVPVPELMIAKASALTSRISLATGVVNLPYHDPFLVAERLAFLDHLTHGRLIYGFGASGLPTDWALFGLEGSDMRPRMDEALDVISQLVAGEEPVTYEGRFWRGENRRLQVRPYKNRVPEIALAGLTSLASFQRAAEQGWSSLSIYFTPPRYANNPSFPDLAAHGRALDETAAAAGRDPVEGRRNWRVVREVYVADDRETALREIRRGVAGSYDYLLGLGLGPLMKLDESQADDEVTFEWMVDAIPWIVGSPEECVRQVEQLYEEVGGFGTLVLNSRDWVTTDRKYRSLELFARYCMPRLERLTPGGAAHAP